MNEPRNTPYSLDGDLPELRQVMVWLDAAIERLEKTPNAGTVSSGQVVLPHKLEWVGRTVRRQDKTSGEVAGPAEQKDISTIGAIGNAMGEHMYKYTYSRRVLAYAQTFLINLGIAFQDYAARTVPEAVRCLKGEDPLIVWMNSTHSFDSPETQLLHDRICHLIELDRNLIRKAIVDLQVSNAPTTVTQPTSGVETSTQGR